MVWIKWAATGERVFSQGRALRIAALRQRVEALSGADRQVLRRGLGVIDRLLEGW